MDATSQDTNVSEPEANAEDNPQTTESVEGIPSKPEAVKYDTHYRVLQESKKNKERAQLAEKELERLERQRLEEEGKIKELWERDRGELEKLRSEVKLKEIRAQVTSVAMKEGCVDVDALLAVGNKQYLEWDDDDFTLKGVEDFVAAAKRDKAYLFRSNKQSLVNPAIPGGNPGTTRTVYTSDTLNKASKSDLDALLAAKMAEEHKQRGF